MSRDLGRDVLDLEELYARKLWADFSYPKTKILVPTCIGTRLGVSLAAPKGVPKRIGIKVPGDLLLISHTNPRLEICLSATPVCS